MSKNNINNFNEFKAIAGVLLSDDEVNRFKGMSIEELDKIISNLVQIENEATARTYLKSKAPKISDAQEFDISARSLPSEPVKPVSQSAINNRPSQKPKPNSVRQSVSEKTSNVKNRITGWFKENVSGRFQKRRSSKTPSFSGGSRSSTFGSKNPRPRTAGRTFPLWAVLSIAVALILVMQFTFSFLPQVAPETFTPRSNEIRVAEEQGNQLLNLTPAKAIFERFAGSSETSQFIAIGVLIAIFWAIGDALSNVSRADWSGAAGLVLAIVAMFINMPMIALLIFISGMFLNFRGKESQQTITYAVIVSLFLFVGTWWLESRYLIWQLNPAWYTQLGYVIVDWLLGAKTTPTWIITYSILLVFDVLYFLPLGEDKDATGQVAFHFVLFAMPITSGFFPFSSIPADFHVWSGFENFNMTTFHSYANLLLAGILIARELGLGRDEEFKSEPHMKLAVPFNNTVYVLFVWFIANTLIKAYDLSLLIALLVAMTIPGAMMQFIFMWISWHSDTSAQNFKQYVEEVMGDVVPILVSIFPNSGVNMVILVIFFLLITFPELLAQYSLLP